jgi:hypothetical protein
VPLEQLPTGAPDDQLSSECHSFGRVFLAAWYDMMVNIYEFNKNKGMEPKLALIQARDTSYLLVLQAATQVPRTAKLHEALAKIMISLAPAEYQTIVSDTFRAHNMFGTQLRALSNIKWEEFSAQGGMLFTNRNSKFVVVPEKRTITLAHHVADHQMFALSVGGYNLANVEVEVAADKYYEFDLDGNLVDMIAPDEADVVEATRVAVSSITSIGPHEDTMWMVKDGKLTRTYID